MQRAWLAVGWFGIALLIYLSLMPNPPEIDIVQGDKLEHIAAYGTLMFWFAQVPIMRDRRLITALVLFGLGVVLEFVQGATGYRTFSYGDMAADAIGVALGGLLALRFFPNLLTIAQRIAASRIRS